MKEITMMMMMITIIIIRSTSTISKSFVQHLSNIPGKHETKTTKHIATCEITLHVTNLLTPWSRVLLEKLTGLQLVKKFPAFYGTRRFLTALTSAHHLSLS
jgi:hypothetical protein